MRAVCLVFFCFINFWSCVDLTGLLYRITLPIQPPFPHALSLLARVLAGVHGGGVRSAYSTCRTSDVLYASFSHVFLVLSLTHFDHLLLSCCFLFPQAFMAAVPIVLAERAVHLMSFKITRVLVVSRSLARSLAHSLTRSRSLSASVSLPPFLTPSL